jgi:hypothetical protein
MTANLLLPKISDEEVTGTKTYLLRKQTRPYLSVTPLIVDAFVNILQFFITWAFGMQRTPEFSF